MDLLELARTIQEDHRRQIEEATRRRRLIDDASSTSAAASRHLPPARSTGTPRSGQSVPTAPATR